jgi:hypothetical protein
MTKRKGKRRAGAPKPQQVSPKSISLKDMRERLSSESARDIEARQEVIRAIDLETESRAGLQRHASKMLADEMLPPPTDMLATTFHDEFRRYSSSPAPDGDEALRTAMRSAKAKFGAKHGQSMWGEGGWDPNVGKLLGIDDPGDRLEEVSTSKLGDYLGDDKVDEFRAIQLSMRTMAARSREERNAEIARVLELLIEAYHEAKKRLVTLGKHRDSVEREYQAVLGQLAAAERAERNGGRASELDVLVALGLR